MVVYINTSPYFCEHQTDVSGAGAKEEAGLEERRHGAKHLSRTDQRKGVGGNWSCLIQFVMEVPIKYDR